MTFGDNVRDALDADDDVVEAMRVGRERLLDHVAMRGQRLSLQGGRTSRRGGWAVAVALLGAAAFALFWLQRPLSFRVGDRPGRVGDVVEMTGGVPVGVRFSEGSSLVVQDGGRLRVLATERAGARVLLENGPVDVAIVHRRDRTARWRFEAGPMAVLVTGTTFRNAWDAGEQRFALDMKEGSVVISGACIPAPRTVVAGEQLRLSCQPAEPPLPHGVVAPPSPEERRRPPMPAGSEHPATVTGASPARDWRALLAAGHYDEGLRAAERAGFARVCATANDVDLLALADAARLSGRVGRAIEALSGLRSRFPGSTSAATAAFALGRIAFEWRTSYAEAAHWFAAYLDEDPTGPLMGDAVGRLLESHYRAGDRADARREAERYLRRFPRGPYAATATAILSE
jgi:hypothetical protein